MTRLVALAFLVSAATVSSAFAQAPATHADELPRNWTYERRGGDGFYGTILIGKGDRIVAEESRGSRFTQTAYEREAARREVLPDDFESFKPGETWRWASVTKQVIAVLIMQEVVKGQIELDAPITKYLPAFVGPTGARITVRQLLRHQSGIPNPDDTPLGEGGVPSYYLPTWVGSRDATTGFCAGKPLAEPGGAWRYNNCDYIIAGALLEAVVGRPWSEIVDERIARVLKLRTLKVINRRTMLVGGFVGADPEPVIDYTAFSASAGLSGTLRDLWAVDRALMTGKLLPPAALAEMWNGDPKLGFMALGQWVFSVPLRGCAAPVRIVERRGAIGGVEVRNFILPDKDVVAIAFTNRSGFDFGEVWQGKGFSYDLLSSAACS